MKIQSLRPPLWIGLAAVTVLVGGLTSSAQSQPAPTEFVAFRVDDRHLIAVIGEVSDAVASEEAREVVAAYGFRHGDANPAVVAEQIPSAPIGIKRWTVRLAYGGTVTAAAGRLVQGSAMCSNKAGILMRVEDADAAAFAAQKEKYFVVEPFAGARPAPPLPPAALPGIDKAHLQALLNDLLSREFPAVRERARDEVERLASSDVAYHRNWARGRQRLDAAIAAGQARLQYDTQAFALDPGGAPYYFVRAEWRVGGDPAFGATVWIKGGERPTIVHQDLSPASFLQMFEFQGKLSREQYGLVLNVLDRDGDGWREILFARGGYEGMSITLETLTPGGFVPTGIAYNYGC